MTPLFFIKVAGIWILFIPVAILNGLLREKVLVSWLGGSIALPLSGISLSVFIFLLTLWLLPNAKSSTAGPYWLIGALWMFMTMIFEFLFGNYIMKKSWGEILEVFNVSQGNLWLLVLLITAVSPYLTARLRNLFNQ